MEEEALLLESAHESFRIPWEDVRLVALGYLEEQLSAEGPRSALRKMISKMMSGGEDDERARPAPRRTYLLDLYVEGRAAPFRFDSATVNYRAFLGPDVSYMSFQNFFRLTHRLGRASRRAWFSPSAAAFLARRKEMVQSYPAVYDFELDTQAIWEDPERRAVAWSEVEFQSENWASEWSEAVE